MLLQKWQTNRDRGAEVRLKHKWSESCSVFGGNASHYTGHSVVGDGIDWPYDEYTWQSLMRCFGRWIKDVKNDLDTPDLWAELQRDARLLASISGKASEKNSPFTSEEKKRY